LHGSSNCANTNTFLSSERQTNVLAAADFPLEESSCSATLTVEEKLSWLPNG
jgi:hypothetical protein